MVSTAVPEVEVLVVVAVTLYVPAERADGIVKLQLVPFIVKPLDVVYVVPFTSTDKESSPPLVPPQIPVIVGVVSPVV